MSFINEALRRASKENKEQTVIPVPRTAQNQLLSLAVVLLFAALIFIALQVWSQKQTAILTESKVDDIVRKHTDLMNRIYSSDTELDTRLQLEIYDMKTEIYNLSKKVEGLDAKALDSVRYETYALGNEMKDQFRLVNKRLNNGERERSILADRIEQAS